MLCVYSNLIYCEWNLTKCNVQTILTWQFIPIYAAYNYAESEHIDIGVYIY